MFLLCTTFFLSACQDKSTTPDQNTPNAQKVALQNSDKQFKDYWYQGKAEINSYKLEQARYGEIREGEAVLIFVTEPFSRSKQVKLDNPSRAGDDNVSVLKCNATRSFITGVYPYSTMQSVFTPVELAQYPFSLKATTSTQEWCGQTFMQLNLAQNKYEVAHNSYFEAEGDKNYEVDKVMLEEEIFNRIRIAPKSLPTGQIQMLPSTLFTRLKHTPFQAFQAKASLETSGKNEMIYSVDYPRLSRKLSIRFNKKFPHEILSWEETTPSGYGANARLMTTRATRKETSMLDYWQRNAKSDEGLRKKLKLEM